MKAPLQNKSHMIDLLFTLALFCVFAATSLLVVMIGADVYRRTADSMNCNFELRTSLTYVSEKIRQSDTEQAVVLGELNGVPALILEQHSDYSGTYRTYIYHYDGTLRELFARADATVSLDSGQVITRLRGFSVTAAGEGLYRISCVGADAVETSVLTGVRCG